MEKLRKKQGPLGLNLLLLRISQIFSMDIGSWPEVLQVITEKHNSAIIVHLVFIPLAVSNTVKLEFNI